MSEPQSNPAKQQPSISSNQHPPASQLTAPTTSSKQTVATLPFNMSNTVANYLGDKIETSIPRLKGNNWATWKWQLTNVLDAKGLTPVLTSNEPRGSTREVAVRQIISSSLDSTLVSKVIHCSTAQDIWTCLQGIFENKTSFALTDLIGKMNSYHITSMNQVEDGIAEIQSLACQIKALNGHADDATIESAILRALPEEFSGFITSWSFLDAHKRTLNNLQAHLMRTVCQMKSSKQSGNIKERALSVTRTTSATGKTTSKKDSVFCRYCKKKNHTIQNCRKLERKRSETKAQDPTKISANVIEKVPGSEEVNTTGASYGYVHVAIDQATNSCLKATTSLTSTDYENSTWIADSGASFHMTSNLKWISNYETFKAPIRVKLGDDHLIEALGSGQILHSSGTLQPVYYLPAISSNLFSISSCAKNHKIFSFTTDEAIVFFKDQKELFRGVLTPSGIYEITFKIKRSPCSNLMSASLTEWHDRMGHVSNEILNHMANNNIVEDLNISNINRPVCEPCIYGKQRKASHPPKSTPRGSKAGEILHFDTIGKMPIASLGGAFYYVLSKDSFSNYREVFFVATKDLIPDKVKEVINRSRLETGNETLQIVTDQGSEFYNSNLNSFLQQHGIIHQKSAAATPQQNGYIERDIRTVAEAAKSIRIRAKLPDPFWAEAIANVVYTLNRVVNSTNRMKTPFELRFNRKPSLKNIHRFGQFAIVYVQERYRDKLDKKGNKMVFVGYTDLFNTFRFIDPNTNRLHISCDAVFIPDSVPNHEFVSDTTSEDDDENVIITAEVPNHRSIEPFQTSPSSNQDISQIDADISDFVSMPSSPSDIFNQSSTDGGTLIELNNNYHPDVTPKRLTPAKMPPQSADPERLASLRPRKNNPIYTDWAINLSSTHHINDPQSYKEAISRPDKEQWIEAMRDELNSLAKNHVWDLVKRPVGKNIITNRWVFRVKYSPDGKKERYKARLVARGFCQVFGTDYSETYAPTASMSIIRFLFAHAAVHNLKMAQFDIKCAFLYGDLEEEVYMLQPDGFDAGDDKVCRLRKSLYGLKQAPRQWCKKFTSFLIEIGLTPSKEENCVFYHRQPLIIVTIYVDDGVIFAERQEDIDRILSLLANKFEMRSLKLCSFLGFQIEKQQDFNITLHQTNYVNKIVNRFASGTKYEKSPISPCGNKIDDTLLSPDVPYNEIVGSLLYASIITRLDIAFAVHKASRALARPTKGDLNFVDRILRYLANNSTFGLSYSNNRHRGLVAYTDADFAGDETSAKSTTGSVVIYAGSPIHWRSSLQTLVTKSSTAAEIVSIDTTLDDIIWLSNFAKELQLFPQEPITIYCDSESVIRLSLNEKTAQKNRHLRTKLAFIKERISANIIQLRHVKSKFQLADMLTKALPVNEFVKARNSLMVDSTIKVAAISLLAILATGSTNSYKFDTIKPIVYQSTDKYVDIGETEYTVDFTYDNPCEILDTFLPKQETNKSDYQNIEVIDSMVNNVAHQHLVQTNSIDANYVKMFTSECNKLYQDTWLVKVKELLSRQQRTFNKHAIHKRSIGDAVMGAVVFNFIESIFERINPWSNYHKNKHLAELQQEEHEKLLKFKHDFNVSVAIQRGMIDLIQENSRSIREQKRQLTQFAQLSSQLTWLSSYIQSRIMFATSDLRTIIDEFIHHRVATLELSELFNMTELRGIDPQETEFVSATKLSDRTIRFKFNIRLNSPDTSVYRIHAFRYWDDLTNTPSIMEYHGSQFVIYNKTSDCMRGIEETTERNIMADCSEYHFKDTNVGPQMWRKIITTENIYSQDIASYKRTTSCNYVYCFPFNISINNELIRCPTLMFKLPLDKAFTILSKRNTSYIPRINKIKLSKQERFIEDVSVYHFNESTIAASDVAMFDRVQELRRLNSELRQEHERSITIVRHGWTWWLTIFIATGALTVTLALVTWNIRMSHQVKKNNKSMAKDVAEIKLYDKLSCANCAANKREAAMMQEVPLDTNELNNNQI